MPPLLAVGFGLSTLTAFVIAATVGLFGVEERLDGVGGVDGGRGRGGGDRGRGGLLLREDNPLRSRAQSQHHTPRACAPPLTRCRRGRGVPAVSRIVMPPTERQLPTCSVCRRGPDDDRVVHRGRQLVLHRLRLVGAGEQQPGAPRDLLQPDGRLHRDVARPGPGLVRDRASVAVGAGAPGTTASSSPPGRSAGQRSDRGRRRRPARPRRGCAAACRGVRSGSGRAAACPAAARRRGCPARPRRHGPGVRGGRRPPGRRGRSSRSRAGAAQRQALAGAQGAEHVGRVIEREGAGHALTPISSSAS